MKVTIEKDELFNLIKKAVREVIQEETISFFLKSIPPVSQEEMEDIKKLYGKPMKEKKVAHSEVIEI